MGVAALLNACAPAPTKVDFRSATDEIAALDSNEIHVEVVAVSDERRVSKKYLGEGTRAGEAHELRSKQAVTDVVEGVIEQSLAADPAGPGSLLSLTIDSLRVRYSFSEGRGVAHAYAALSATSEASAHPEWAVQIDGQGNAEGSGGGANEITEATILALRECSAKLAAAQPPLSRSEDVQKAADAKVKLPPVRFSFCVGYASYGMSDVNGFLDDVNEAVLQPGGTGRLEPVGPDLNRWWEFSYVMQGRWMVGVGISSLWASSDFSGPEDYPGEEFSGVAYTANGSAIFASLRDRFYFYGGGELGWIEVNAFTPDENGTLQDVTGDGPHLAALIGTEIHLGKAASLLIDGGWRWSVARTLRVDGRIIRNREGQEIDVEYTGPFARIGIAWRAGEGAGLPKKRRDIEG